MRILITGSNGFIGRYLKQYLSVQHDIVAPSSKELDLTNEYAVSAFFKDCYFDTVIHAAVKGRNNVTDQSDNLCNEIVIMFENLFQHSKHYNQFIHFGSGAEFGLNQSIDNVHEDDVLKCFPKESYGLGKNIVARAIKVIPNFYNLRVFSCFDPSESESRLITKFKKTVEEEKVFEIDQDRYVDFVTLHDIAVVVDAVLNNQITDNDINIVYQQKMLVSDILYKYCKINNIDINRVIVTGHSNKNYTGNGDRLAKYNLNLEGMVPTLQRYKHGSI
jgi:GDP-L-fucose synthase